MSRKSIAEYVAEKRRVYAKSGSAKRTRMIDEVCETLGYTRKYVIKLLTGNIRYRERKGRGKTYGDSVLANVRKLWEAVGCPCTTYFVAELPRIVREYEACIALIKPKEDKESILAMSASTLDRAFKGLPRIKPFAVKFNRRSGLNRPILDAIECKSGEETMACDVRPGDTQIDTVAHCGGDMRGNFFWTLTQTDRNTQWTEITTTWNRGMHNTVSALKRLERRFPFPITSEHEDNGPEFINYAMAEMQGRRKDISISRSRFYRKNDNAHVEQKNGSVVRELFGELREEFLDFLRVAGRIGCHALAEGVDGRTEVVQLGVVDNHEAVVEVVGIGNRQPLVLLVELGDFGGRGLAAILADEPYGHTRPLPRQHIKDCRVRIRIDDDDFRLRGLDKPRDLTD